MDLDNSGKFFFVEDAVHLPPDDPQDKPRRTISDNPPSGFVDGVPIFHSFPGSANVIYLNFLGGIITGKAWNDHYGIPVIDASEYNTDGVNGFSPAEQQAMASIWRRVAEDYSPWVIDVTTERPTTFTSTVLTATIIRNVGKNGVALPSSTAGGIAYLDIFGFFDAQYYSPALIYYNNLVGGREDIVSEATSHELGHNFGLSHDGVTGGSAYYGGTGSGPWTNFLGANHGSIILPIGNKI